MYPLAISFTGDGAHLAILAGVVLLVIVALFRLWRP